jgi:ABC-type branched-subunit amino acid transport system ATPase component
MNATPGLVDSRELKRGFVLHAVAVASSNGIVLILGHSGAGKTTLGNLLSERFPVVADDIVYITQHVLRKTWYSTDAKRMMSFNSKNFMPILGAVRVFQSNQAQLTRLTPRDFCKHLFYAVLEAEWVYSKRLGREREWFDSVAEIARNYPGFRLNATLDLETPHLVWNMFQ